VVWAPTASGGVHLRRDLGVGPGEGVSLSLAGAALEGVR
jgi:hypothetical protein